MTFILNEQPASVELTKFIDEVLAIDCTPNSDRAQKTSTAFLQSLEFARRIRSIAIDLKACSLDGLPYDQLQGSGVGPFSAVIPQMRLLESYCQGNDAVPIDEIAKVFNERFPSFFANTVDLINRASRPNKLREQLLAIQEQLQLASENALKQVADGEKRQTWFDEQKINFGELAQSHIKTADDYEGRLEQLVSDIEGKLANIGVKDHAVKFDKEATRQQWESFYWLIGAGLAAGGIIGYSLGLEPDVKRLAEESTKVLWPILVIRSVVVSAASVLLFVCVRCFSACRHNMTVNRHRAHALSTFQIFNVGAHDQETKNAVLLEATKAVFAPSPSGYLKAANEANPGTHIIEMIRTHSTPDKTEHS